MKLSIDVEPSPWAEPFLSVVFNCGLNIVNKEKAQVLVKTASELTDDDLNSGLKIIALEKTDGANIAFKTILKHPAVFRYIKSYNYKHHDLHNAACVDGRLFTTMIPNTLEWHKPAVLIDELNYHKIHLGWNFLHYLRSNELVFLEKEELVAKDSHRPIDVFFAGNLHYDNRGGNRKSGELISIHRRECFNILHSLKGLEVIALEGKAINPRLYNQFLCNAKIVVSPWGWGEACYRDYEAILAGCTVIKPLTNFISSACHLFDHPFCSWTKPDFSGLEKDIFSALKNFKQSKVLRMHHRDALIHSINQLPAIVKRNLTF